MNKDYITITKADGSTELMEVVATFKLEETSKDCIIYKSISDEKYYAASYDADSDYSLLCGYDMVVDAIDTVSAKISIAEYCYNHGIHLITATSAGNKTDPTRFTVSDIYSTSVCPICRIS